LEHEAALRNLNLTVHNLRRSLEPDLERGSESRYLHYEMDCYRLDGAKEHWLDVRAFEDRIARARRASSVDHAIALYREALALYQGEYLADFEPDLLDCWMERDRLHQVYLNAMEELVSLHAQQKQLTQATELCQEILAVDPCRETTAQLLMRSELQRGHRAAAVAAYQRLEASLWRELELQPSQQSLMLHEMAYRGG
jgi:DNA-binding SARP family transcriptional activator